MKPNRRGEEQTDKTEKKDGMELINGETGRRKG